MLEQLGILLMTFFFPPLLLLVLLVVALATFGKSLGIRRRLVDLLLKIFEWCRTEVRRAHRAAAEEKLRQEEAAEALDIGRLPSVSNLSDRLMVSGENTHIFTQQNGLLNGPCSIAGLIKRDATERILRKLQPNEVPMFGRVWTIIDDSLDFIKSGVESIIEDEVTQRFLAEDLATWNLLTRTGRKIQHVSWRLDAIWFAGLLIRYTFLFPIRFILLCIGITFMICSTAVIGYVPKGPLKEWLNWRANIISYRICSRAASAIITFHNCENMARPGGICVANHTSPIDVMLLACDNCYALIGQQHGGLLGIIQRALNRASAHIWFERSQANDRSAVAKRMRDHVQTPGNLPILIFPEGTCINNTSVMMFKKGSFEIEDVTIYPVAIKYDPRFGDPFWNSSQQSWAEYLLMMMTSWAIVAEVWYLPPMKREPNEDAIEFAARVKRKIAETGGLTDMGWDGQLKRISVPQKLRLRQQKLYSDRLERAQKKSVVGNENLYYAAKFDSANSSTSDMGHCDGKVFESPEQSAASPQTYNSQRTAADLNENQNLKKQL